MLNDKPPANKKEKLLADDFPGSTCDEWRKEVDKLLKGSAYEKRMIAETCEGIPLKPIYFDDDTKHLKHLKSLPGFPPYTRGKSVLSYVKNPWEIAQEIPYSLPAQFNKALRFDLERGQTAINIIPDKATRLGKDPDQAKIEQVCRNGVSISSLIDLKTALHKVDIEKLPVYIRAGVSALPFAAMLIAYALKHDIDIKRLRGCIAADPLGELAVEGSLPGALEDVYNEMYSLTRWAKDNAPQLQTIGVNSKPYHNGGGNAIEELACAIAAAVDYMKEMQSRNLNIDDIAPRICFTFSIGSSFFIEIAKLRAARMVWAKVVKACGGNEQSQSMTVHVSASGVNKTLYDPYVNLLRSATEAFSGVIGGCDSMHVGYFDEVFQTPDEFSRRISRNIQLILRQESHLDKVIDPAAGSWYVESLTDSIARKSWRLFQEIEKKGGMFKALQEGFPQDTIATTATIRKERLAKCKDVKVGINMYSNPTEKLPEKKAQNHESNYKKRLEQIKTIRSSSKISAGALVDEISKSIDSIPDKLMDIAIEAAKQGATIGEITSSLRQGNIAVPAIKPIIKFRTPEMYEDIRKDVETYSLKTGISLKVFLANLGTVSQFKPRSAYASNFFQTGGYELIDNDGFSTSDDAVKAALESDAQVVVICSTDEKYPEFVPTLAKAMKKAQPDVIIVLAGYPKEHIDSFKQAGVDEFIYRGVNVYETLVRISKRVGAIL